MVLMGMYLTLVDDDADSSMDNLVDIMLTTVLTASIYFAASIIVKAFHAFWFMLLMSTIGERLGISWVKSF